MSKILKVCWKDESQLYKIVREKLEKDAVPYLTLSKKVEASEMKGQRVVKAVMLKMCDR